LPLARQRDQRALGEALSARETEPEPEAAAIEAEIERNVHRENAMSGQVLEAQRRVAELILRSKGAWTGDLQRHLADAAARYRSQIVELERARAELVEEVQLGAWLAMSPQTGGQPATYQLPGEPDTVAPGPAVASVMAALRRDSEQLPPPRPGAASPNDLRRLDHQQLVLESVDAEGNVHPQVSSATRVSPPSSTA